MWGRRLRLAVIFLMLLCQQGCSCCDVSPKAKGKWRYSVGSVCKLDPKAYFNGKGLRGAR